VSGTSEISMAQGLKSSLDRQWSEKIPALISSTISP
jgi:hypothetical protein